VAGGGQASNEAVELELLSGHAGRRTLGFINRCGDVRPGGPTGPVKDTPRIPGWSGNLWVRLSPAGRHCSVSSLETSDPEPSPPRGGDAARAVRGLPTAGVPGGRPAPVHPVARPAHTLAGRAAPAGVAPRLCQGSAPVGLAASGQAGPPGGLGGQRQAGPAVVARRRPQGAVPQAQETPPRDRHRRGGHVPDRPECLVGPGLPVRHHRGRPDSEAVERHRRSGMDGTER
jgi:hypothetical protein